MKKFEHIRFRKLPGGVYCLELDKLSAMHLKSALFEDFDIIHRCRYPERFEACQRIGELMEPVLNPRPLEAS